jgi:hypothetical protein
MNNNNNLFNSLFSNLNNDNSFIFDIPLNNSNIFNSIETMLEELQNNININNVTDNNENNNEFVEFNIQFEFINTNNNENNNYFKNCTEINEKLGKPIKIKKNDIIETETENCFICMESYNYGEFKRLLPNCKHCFHKKCIDKWLKKNASCPVCRDELKKDS